VFDSIRDGDKLQIRRVNYDEMYLTVLKKYDDKIHVYAETNLIIGWGYQIINRNNYHILENVTSFDKRYLNNIELVSPDIIGLSFTDCPDILYDLRNQLSSTVLNSIHIFAKIETKYAINRIHDLINAAEGIVIGRDDLLAWYSQIEINELVNSIILLCKAKNIPVIPASNYFLSLGHNEEMTKDEYDMLLSLLSYKPDYVYVNETNKNPDWRIFCNTIKLLLKETEGKL